MQEIRERQAQMWAAGDYSVLAPYIAHVGERVVARVGVDAGMRVLDVACGTGNAALPAARAGAQVTGLDNQVRDGSLHLPQEYLLSIVRC
jgi:2-polyprenyl-3-methyl-5-hydroxy-6-metoxy-1,4-benzoquinol methylase